MNIASPLKAAIAALLLGGASHAMADVIQINASSLPAANVLLAAGTYQGSFNLAGVQGLPGAYTINSLSFSFKFLDDGSDLFTTVTGNPTGSRITYTTTGGGQNKTAVTTTTYLVAATKTGEQESVTLSFGGSNFFGQTAAVPGAPATPVTTSKSPVSAGTKWAKNNGVPCTTQEVIDHDASCKLMAHQTVEATETTTTTTDYAGDFTLGGTLLASMLKDKALNFSFDVFGDLFLAGATLDIDYSATQSLDANTDVPEPASLALFGIALAGIAGVRRQRRG